MRTMDDKTVTVEVEVSEFDIRHGEKANCRNCPVAMAINRRMGRWNVHALVTDHLIELKDPRKVYKPTFTPDEVRKFIWRFDRGERVYPFRFALEVPAAIGL
jgi:anti-sigma regulatory factor (Ser/Thr protein kinase)